MGEGRDDAIQDDEDFDEDEESEEDELTPEEQREINRQDNLSECISIAIFVVYLIIFTLSLLGDQSVRSSRFADHIRTKLEPPVGHHITLDSVRTIPHFYSYLEEVFLPGMYENYTDARLARMQSEAFHPIDMSNRMIGSVRLRQVRVSKQDDCQVSPLFAQWKVACYPPFTSGVVSKADYGPEGKFKWSIDPNGGRYTGQLAAYPPEGFAEFLSTNRTRAQLKIRELVADNFLDEATRAVFVDFSLWSMNIGSYAAVTIAVEFGPSGSTYQEIYLNILSERSLSFSGSGSLMDWIAGLLMLLVICGVFWYILEEAKELWTDRLDYFMDGWNVMDWVNMLLILVTFVLRVLVWVEADSAKIGVGALEARDSYANLRGIAAQVEMVRLLMALNAVLLWLKCVKYCRKVPVVKLLIRTVWDALALLLPFFFMFSLSFLGFTIAYHVGFGNYIKELSNFGTTVVYLLRSYLGNVKMMPAYEVDPLFGALMILLFYVTLVLVGITVICAIFSDAIFKGKVKRKISFFDRKDDLHEDEPCEEFIREVTAIANGCLRAIIPRQFHHLIWKQKKKKGPEAEADFIDLMGDQEKSEDGGSQMDDNLSQEAESFDEFDDESEKKKEKAISRQDLKRAIEHMSGRVLSEISIVGIEIRMELHDICERVAQLQMICEELTWRAERVKKEQDKMLE
eukprot:TRINITY_DN61609_c0_g1_i1.p1 TRINITY_DN61609_c0_g1~~TRINITY_DN61609_c0_g1_i1.p1  ORF type:complete len:684 (-),score=150.48 TRINITY_DN61609_c0_g1_i1:66-2117(-)